MTTAEVNSLHEYICNLCESKGVSIDLRFGCLGDINAFYIGDRYISLHCDEYYEPDIKNIRKLFDVYITLCKRLMQPSENRIALYIEDIIYEDGWYRIIAGACTFKDGSIT